ncbi:MAG: GTPase HflX [Clostridia bacterium]|nr:GTPase HflX [Clostridia bacterium]
MINVIIINAYFEGEDAVKKYEEIASLCDATDSNIVACFNKLVLRPNPATVIGKGKLYEIAETVKEKNAETVIYNGELSPSQTLNIADIVGCTVITKTNLILEIFARRATSNEGKVLVELAQLKYLYPRLKGKGDSLSRQGGGIGTTGPGETKLETDRRYIRGRINFLEKKLKEISARQKLSGARRRKNAVKTVAVVGYTNVGKSTLINLITDSDLKQEDAVFVTLDPSARYCRIFNEKVIFIDTVGFITDLPESLVEAFKSTLEAAKTADLILCVSDISDDFDAQRAVTDKILDEIGASSNRTYVLNKCDLYASGFANKEYLKISAKNQIGIDQLKETVYKNLFGEISDYSIVLPYEKSPTVRRIEEISAAVDVVYNDDGISINGKINDHNKKKLYELI